MKSFIKHLVLFALLMSILLFVQKTILNSTTPWYWGNKTLSVKIEYLTPRLNQYDVIFVGTSRGIRGFNPSVFDSITGLKSFNLSVPGLKSPEFDNTVEYLISNKTFNGRTKYLLLETVPTYLPNPKKKNVVRRNYWMNIKNYLFVARNYLEELRLFTVGRMTESLIRHETRYGLALEQVKYQYNKKDLKWLGKNKDGYYSFKNQLQDRDTSNILDRQSSFLEDTIKIVRRKRTVLKEYNKSIKVNSIRNQKMNKLIDMGKANGIKVIFIKMPLQPNVYSIYKNLDQQNKVDLSHPKEYPAFYRAAHVQDKGHFNYKGARIFSRELAKKFKNKLDNEE